ncbi:uncharacterized protein At5g39865 [Magnolia sinica]|uniref:uncharacterized protein At5g39865 n=1 Tax=Magnolia sinica TaxID=86752 RepID=UPI002657EA90|nr:uncharacterized protein At5g39865 [Magnolia sinica]
MGCTSSHLLEDDEDYTHFGGSPSGLGHHIVSLTSTTYGLLTLDSPQRSPTVHPQPITPRLVGLTPLPEPRCRPSEPEIINSWELMAGLDNDSFRFSPIPLRSSLLHNTLPDLDTQLSWPSKPSIFNSPIIGKENKENRPIGFPSRIGSNVFKLLNTASFPTKESVKSNALDGFEKRCPPGGENAVVIYTTTLRGIRKTFEDCNAVRVALEGVGVWVKERDVSMHSGYREELRELMEGKGGGVTVPRVFVKGRYIGGAEEVLKIHEEGGLAALVEGLPKVRVGAICDGCGGARFLPCFRCSGSCKVVKEDGRKVVRCPECNENGLVLCPICS